MRKFDALVRTFTRIFTVNLKCNINTNNNCKCNRILANSFQTFQIPSLLPKKTLFKCDFNYTCLPPANTAPRVFFVANQAHVLKVFITGFELTAD